MKWLSLAITTTCLIFSSVHAGDYELASILKLAEQHNKQLELARSDLKTASAEKLNAFSRALPKLNVNAGYNRNLQENFVFFPDIFGGTDEIVPIKISFANEYSLNATLSQTLFSFEVGYAIQASRYLSRLTENQYESTLQRVRRKVKGAFYQALLLAEVMKVARDSEASARSNYDNTKLKFDNGIVSEFDLLQAEVRWQNSIPERTSAEQNYQLAINSLKQLVGFPLDEEINLVGSLQTFPEVPSSLTTVEVLEKRPDFQALNWERKLREKDVSAQRAGFFPSLDGTFRYTYSAASDSFKLEQENDNYILGLSLNIPLFNGGATIANVRRASAEVDRVKTRIDEARESIDIELRNIRLRLAEAQQRIEATRRAAYTARRAFDIAETRLQNGLATQIELKDSRLELDRSQVNHFSAIYDYLSAYFDWEVATGTSQFSGM